MTPLIIFILFIHVICAVFLVGSSIFVWIVIWPASSLALKDEKLRTRFMSIMGKRYALYTNISVILLTVTGLLLVALYYPVYFYNIGGRSQDKMGVYTDHKDCNCRRYVLNHVR